MPVWGRASRPSRQSEAAQDFGERTRAGRGSPAQHMTRFALHTPMCNNLHMATNLALDDKLIKEAQRAGKHKTKKDAVTAALAEYIKRGKQTRILEAFGSVEFDPAYDYKAGRRRPR